jgi:Mg2+ and Co2+ transporter CorA
MAEKEYVNRHWHVNDDVFELHFTQFYEDEIILKFVVDKDDQEVFRYVCDLLKVEDDCIIADSIDDAMEQFEDMIEQHIEDEVNYYEEMLDKFKEFRIGY